MITRNHQKNVRTASAQEMPSKDHKLVNSKLLSTPILRKYKTNAKLVDVLIPR